MKRDVLKRTAAGVAALLMTAAILPASVPDVMLLASAAEESAAPAEEETAPAAEEAPETGSEEPEDASALEVTVSDEISPIGQLVFGSTYSVRGVISSESTLAKVFGGIYTADGEQVIYHEEEPNESSCNLASTFDPVIPFAALPVGDYVYKIEVTDTDGRTVTAIESAFTVADTSGIESEITIAGESKPAEVLPLNCVFSVRGTIASSFVLSKVWGGVYNADGTKTDVYYEDTPNTTSYSLLGAFDNNLDFSLLTAGDYVYRIEATDARGNSKVLIEQNFSITADETAPSEIQLYNPSYPTGTLQQGKGVSIKGSIYSTYAIESVTGGIYKAEGSDCDYDDRFAFTVEGGKRSFNLSTIDNDIVFGDLPVGEYEYRITVTDVKGYTKELIRSSFRIRSTADSDEKQQIVMKGIDVSSNNQITDWEKVYADGVDFAILRAGTTNKGDANYFEDRDFLENYTAAKNAGLKVGAYLFTSAITKSEMKADVDALLQTLEGHELDMPVYIDLESSRQTSLGKQALTELVAYGCELLDEGGYKAGVYASYNWFRDYIDADALTATGCEIWLAFWPNDPASVNLSEFCVTWQYCSDGTVDGITGNVDRDYRYAALSEESFAVTIEQPEGATVFADKETAALGQRVTISAELDRKHILKSVKANGMEASDNGDGTFSFSMPAENVTITVELEECDPEEGATDFGTITEMPTQFGTAGTSAPYYARPCNERISTLPEALMNLAEGGNSWEYNYPADSSLDPLTLMGYANIYSFIHDHDLDPEAVRAVLSDGSKMIHRIPFTDEEIDILLGDDAAKAMECFASPSTIVIGERGYSAKWMYTHTIEDYKAAGITPEMVIAVMPNYYNPLYVQEAADAFSQKLFAYTSVLVQTKWDQWTFGDVDQNGTVDEADAVLLESYLNYEKRLGFTQWASADLTHDSAVDAQDLDALRNKLADTSEPAHSVMLDVIEFCQYPDYPTGCESVSLYMLLNYYGVDVTVEQIYDKLPMGPQPYYDEDGIKYGANPEREFVGDPRSENSFGVFNDPIAKVAETFKSGVAVKNGATIEEIQAILDTGNPVLAWYVSAPMRQIMYRRSWVDYETGEMVYWPGGEHAIVICGYDDNSLTYRDPNAGTTVTIDYDTFRKSYEELGARIVYYPAETPDAPKYYASVERLCEMAKTDYEVKNEVLPESAKATENEDGSLTIVLSDAEGKALDTYTIDPETATGTDSAGAKVDLPQTGNNDPAALVLGILAMLVTASGTYLLYASRRGKREE